MSITKKYSSSGVTCKVTFSYPLYAAEGVKTVQILGDFNNWDAFRAPKMKKSKDEFSITLELNTGRIYEFRYLLDGNRWDNDYNADNYSPAPYAGVKNSVLVLDAIPAKGKGEKKAKAEKKEKQPKPVKAKAPKAEKKAGRPAKAAKADAAPAAEKPARGRKPKAEKPAADKPARKAGRPATKAVKASSGNDDLKRIEGVGPKIEELLHKSGISTFAGLASASSDSLKKILSGAGPRYKMHDPATWTKQASLAANGKWDELKKLQDELVGGKKK